MDPEHWKRIERLYHSLLAYPSERRTAVLEQSCSDDPDLMRELKALLQAREEAGSFLSDRERFDCLANLGSKPMPSMEGSTLGPYRILTEIGVGAMGVVYRALDTRLDRQVALKILPAQYTQDSTRVARFRTEAKAASALNHPNIVTIYEIGQANGSWFIAEELIDGVTLRQQLALGGLPIDKALDIASQCAVALQAAHDAGILHRDIKPENVMVRPDGIVKIVDFGLARISDTGADFGVHATQTGSVIGTPRYMSPEQARGEELDARTDIFSLGAVLFEMVMGCPAFPGATPAEVFAALLGKERVARVGGVLDVVVAKALAKDRDSRHQTLGELAQELKLVDPLQQKVTIRWRLRSRRIRGRLMVAALLLVACAIVAWYGWTARRQSVRDRPTQLVPLTTFEGDKDYAAFSPDGTRIAFSWNAGRQGTRERHIYVKEVGTGEPIQLTSAPEDDTWPAWSPDSRRIAFVRLLPDAERAIYVVPPTGGSERKLAEGGDGVSWSPDGKWLVLANAPKPKGSGSLFLLSVETGERRQLGAPQNGSDCFPVYSPDGKWIAFLRMGSVGEVFIAAASGDPKTHPAKQLTFDGEPKLGLTWTASAREIVYSTLREYGGSGLWRVPISGGERHRILPTLLFAANPNISRSGDRLAYTESWIDSNIYQSEVLGFAKPGVPQPFGESKKMIASSHEDHSPSFSPNGERIAFVSNRTGNSEIWTARRDGSGQTQLTHFESFTGTPRWSPDARWIVFDCIIRGNADIWVIPSTGGTPRRLTTDSAADTMPSWSPNGAWIYFNSERSGSPQIWKMKPDGSAVQQVTREGGREPLSSSDGRTIYYTKIHGGAPIWQVPAEGGLEEPVAGMEQFNNIGRAWGVLPQGIYFVSRQEGTEADTIRFFSFANRRATPLCKWERTARWTSPVLALSPNGEHLLTVRIDQQVNDLMMVENFR